MPGLARFIEIFLCMSGIICTLWVMAGFNLADRRARDEGRR